MLDWDPAWPEMFSTRGALSAVLYRPGPVKIATSWVRRVRVTRELTGDLPAEVTQVTGAVTASAELGIDLATPEAPRPYIDAERDEWLGRPLVIEAGFDRGPSVPLVPVFSGLMRKMTFDESTQTGRFTVTENADSMREPATLAPFGSSATRMTPDRIIRYPTNLSAVVAHVFNASHVRVTPAPVDGAQIAVPLAGGFLPETGWAVPQGPGYPSGSSWLVDGLFKVQGQPDVPSCPRPVLGSVWLHCYPSKPYPVSPSTTRLQFWTLASPSSPVNALRLDMRTAYLTVRVDTHARALFNGASTGPSAEIPPDGVPHQVTVDYNHANGGVSVEVDQLGSTSGSTTATAADASMYLAILDGPIQAVSMRTYAVGETVPPVSGGYFFLSQSSVEKAALDIDTVPGVDSRVGWDLAKEVAAAELGAIGFSEVGWAYFRTRNSVNAEREPVMTYDTDVVDTIAGSVSTDSVRTRVTTTLDRSWFLDSGSGSETPASTAVPAYISGDVLAFPSGTSEHILSGSLPWVPVQSAVTIISASGEAWDVRNGMVLCNDNAGSSRYTGTQVSASIHPLSSTSWKLVVRNDTGSTKWAVWPTAWSGAGMPFGREGGQGAVWVNGLAVVEGMSKETTVVTRDAPNATTVRTLDLPANPWRQDPATTRTLADKIVSETSRPRTEYGDIVIPGDPRLQIGDVVLLVDHLERVPDLHARIVRSVLDIDTDAADDGMQTTLSLRSLPPIVGGRYGQGAYGAGVYGE